MAPMGAGICLVVTPPSGRSGRAPANGASLFYTCSSPATRVSPINMVMGSILSLILFIIDLLFRSHLIGQRRAFTDWLKAKVGEEGMKHLTRKQTRELFQEFRKEKNL